MNHVVRAAALQMSSTTEVEANLAAAERLIEAAAAERAELVVLPELFPCLGDYQQTAAAAQPIPGPLSERLSRWAARFQLTLVAGSVCEAAPVGGKCFNTSLVFGPAGELLASYRKLHLFDVDLLDSASLRESDHFAGGEAPAVVETGVGRCGLAICYDARFPELFRILSSSGAELIAMPAAFTAVTGAAHWHTLLRARAIDNQVYLVAANQAGRHSAALQTYGHSLIVDPWGEVLAEAGAEGEAVIVAELSAERLRSVRQRVPALRHRRL